MSCTFCESPLPAGARYCPNCGTAVEPWQTAAPTQPGKWDDAEASTYPEPFLPARSVSPAPTTSTTAILSLICGIAAWTILPVIGAILAILFGHAARGEIARSRGTLEGDGLAAVGIALGYAQVGLLAGLFIVILMFLIAMVA